MQVNLGGILDYERTAALDPPPPFIWGDDAITSRISRVQREGRTVVGESDGVGVGDDLPLRHGVTCLGVLGPQFKPTAETQRHGIALIAVP